MKKPSAKSVVFSLVKTFLVSITIYIFLLFLYFYCFKAYPFGLDASIIEALGFVSGFVYYFWFEQKKLFPKDEAKKS
ncbi:hypothetical protein [Dyella sp.]|uniref:hypothetical protein n=1 Tax=Dyella sp. TaxID=1869338 RepID=UPI002B484F88|nr:hypothetical protein [Dyella sp.]HKT29465.1 hypothetical protein [Dyella sp.]